MNRVHFCQFWWTFYQISVCYCISVSLRVSLPSKMEWFLSEFLRFSIFCQLFWLIFPQGLDLHTKSTFGERRNVWHTKAPTIRHWFFVLFPSKRFPFYFTIRLFLCIRRGKFLCWKKYKVVCNLSVNTWQKDKHRWKQRFRRCFRSFVHKQVVVVEEAMVSNYTSASPHHWFCVARK